MKLFYLLPLKCKVKINFFSLCFKPYHVTNIFFITLFPSSCCAYCCDIWINLELSFISFFILFWHQKFTTSWWRLWCFGEWSFIAFIGIIVCNSLEFFFFFLSLSPAIIIYSERIESSSSLNPPFTNPICVSNILLFCHCHNNSNARGNNFFFGAFFSR